MVTNAFGYGECSPLTFFSSSQWWRSFAVPGTNVAPFPPLLWGVVFAVCVLSFLFSVIIVSVNAVNPCGVLCAIIIVCNNHCVRFPLCAIFIVCNSQSEHRRPRALCLCWCPRLSEVPVQSTLSISVAQWLGLTRTIYIWYIWCVYVLFIYGAHIYICTVNIYGAYTFSLAEKSRSKRSYTVYVYGSGQP